MAAESSALLALAGVAIPVVRSFFILPRTFAILVLASIPGCGLAAVASGGVGIKRARADGGPKVRAVFGFLGGLFVLVISVPFLFELWVISRSNWQF
jgi:RsiW-degrading membrane proteinase PrsW (M82 family)